MMTIKRIVWTDPNGAVRVTTPAAEAMTALTGSGGMLHPDKISKQALNYVTAGMSTASASKMAEGYADGGLTETEALDLIRERSIPSNAINIVVIDADELPYFGSFGRAAWLQGGAAVPVFNMARARTIKTNHVRPERNERLKDLDIDYMRADEAGDTAEKQRIVRLKQKLRDLPVTIQPDLDAIDQPEELEAYEPTWPE